MRGYAAGRSGVRPATRRVYSRCHGSTEFGTSSNLPCRCRFLLASTEAESGTGHARYQQAALRGALDRDLQAAAAGGRGGAAVELVARQDPAVDLVGRRADGADQDLPEIVHAFRHFAGDAPHGGGALARLARLAGYCADPAGNLAGRLRRLRDAARDLLRGRPLLLEADPAPAGSRSAIAG